jgi:predicted SAM-dependent methyltransferase
VALPGWVNIDNQPYNGIDFRWDLSRELPFRNVKHAFAEHFIEHLSYDQAALFMTRIRAALRDDGVLRVSTPNLDWVWYTAYHPTGWQDGEEPIRDCFVINRAFRGWGHQFLYNIATLTALLEGAGFETVTSFPYGQSDTPELRGLEHHERYLDAPELPHILIVEARGRRQPAPPRAIVAEYRRDVSLC